MNENIIDLPEGKLSTNLPDTKAKVKVATCPKCGGWVMVAVEHLMDKQSKKDLAKLVIDGHNVSTRSLVEFRKNTHAMHDSTKCK